MITNNDLPSWFVWKKNSKYENNRVNYSSIDANNEDWTGWFFWQLGICVVTYQITSRQIVKSASQRRLSIFQTISTTKVTWMGKNLLLNSISRGLENFNYRNKGRFYIADSCTVFNLILSSTINSTNWQLVKIFNKFSNLFSCEIC